MAKTDLPVVTGSRSIIENIKRVGTKSAKILGHGAAFLGLTAAMGISTALFPVLVPPTFIGAIIQGQRLANNTIYKGYKDLSFITSKKGNNILISQDVTRYDLTAKMKGMNNGEKAAFMQLQAIIGVSKFKPYNSKGEEHTFQTFSHRINQKTFRKLRDLGYIKDYEDKFWKKKRIALAKLGFGNPKDAMKKEDIYDIRFKLTGKPMDLEDPELRRYFPMLFSDRFRNNCQKRI